MPGALTDSELMKRSLADPATFAELFDRHHAELYRYLRRRAGPSLAGDIAAETFLTAFARRDSYQPEGQSVRPWLYGIAHNLLRNQARSERRQWLAYARHGEVPEADQSAADAFSHADRRADATAEAARIGRILAGLPAGDRDALLLFAWADMSYADIASTLQPRMLRGTSPQACTLDRPRFIGPAPMTRQGLATHCISTRPRSSC